MRSEHVNAIIDAATTMPTKQNGEYYSLIASTDRTFNHTVYSLAYDCDNGKNHYSANYNSQVNAHLLLLWCPDLFYNNSFGNYETVGRLCMGISGGGAALTANLLGYRTGFCACYNHDGLKDLIYRTLDLKVDAVDLMLGCGIPNSDYAHNQVVENGTVVKNKGTFTKNIAVHRIE